MAQLFDAQPDNDLPDVPNYNVCPTNSIHVVTGGAGTARRLTAMRWGFLPKWYKKPNDGPLLINARAETIAEKPAFRAAARERRALVVATGFYEWTKTPDGARDPWYITPSGGGALAMAAVTAAPTEASTPSPMALVGRGGARCGDADAGCGRRCVDILPCGPCCEFEQGSRSGAYRTGVREPNQPHLPMGLLLVTEQVSRRSPDGQGPTAP